MPETPHLQHPATHIMSPMQRINSRKLKLDAKVPKIALRKLVGSDACRVSKREVGEQNGLKRWEGDIHLERPEIYVRGFGFGSCWFLSVPPLTSASHTRSNNLQYTTSNLRPQDVVKEEDGSNGNQLDLPRSRCASRPRSHCPRIDGLWYVSHLFNPKAPTNFTDSLIMVGNPLAPILSLRSKLPHLRAVLDDPRLSSSHRSAPQVLAPLAIESRAMGHAGPRAPHHVVLVRWLRGAGGILERSHLLWHSVRCRKGEHGD